MDELGRPQRHRWQEAVILLLIGAESAFTVVDEGMTTEGTFYAILLAVLGSALLARHRHWRWLLPLLLVLNMFVASLVIQVLATYCFATRSRSRLLTLLVGLLSTATILLSSWNYLLPGREIWALGVSVMISATSVAFGMYTQARRQLLAQLRHRAEEAELGRAEAEDQARRAERTRIAREMHDIVAHKISLVALQSGALEVNPNLDREQVVQSAGLIRQTATTALSELREVLGVLRSDEDAPLAPQPTWDDVRGLVETSRAAGITVELFDFIDDPVPDAMARTAYRVVHEGLTNIHKHARHTKARVALIGEPGTDLIIEVSNVLPVGFTTDLPGARMGLSGIETRVAHAGGTITSGPTDDGRFEVKAVIPWPATV